MEQEIVVQRVKAASLARPLFVGAAILTVPLWAIALVASVIGGATINGEHVTGGAAVLAALAFGPLFALTTGAVLWLYVSACLWAYSKWSALRLRYEPR